RYVLPRLFHQIARRPELILLGALAWCFLIGEIAEKLQLSREMGSLVAGVSLSTFPYALDVTAKVTTLRDFFITLFFVALGMTIPIPGMSVIGLALLIALFTIVSRVVTTFVPLYLMKQGLRASLLPAINLAQISEFSLVVIQTGITAKHISAETSSALLAEIERQNPIVLEQITVIDFNPNVFRTLADRGLHVVYGDVSNVDTLLHAGVGKSELIILSVPDSLLKGANNEKLVRHVR